MSEREMTGTDYRRAFRLAASYAEQLEARVAALEAEKDTSASLADVFRLPGVENWLLHRHHPDRYPDADENERRALAKRLQIINAAYEFLERGK